MIEDFERCYRALQSRDPRFDGWFFTAVTSTGIYCRPSCPAQVPQSKNVRFYPTAAAAQQSGFRACLRCRPDAAPGSPEWLGRADVAARAVKLILHGVVDTDGVSGLASRLGYSERQLHRVLMAEVGTGALALARAQRAQTARLLLETTDLPIANVAFAAGFASVRQFNDTVKAIFARTPGELRVAAAKRPSKRSGRSSAFTGGEAGTQAVRDRAAPDQSISLRLAFRQPFCARALIGFLGARAVPGVEDVESDTYSRSLLLPHGTATVALSPDDGFVRGVFTLSDLRDLTLAVARCRHLLNLDADPVAVDEELSKDPMLRPLVDSAPGLRVPGAVDGFEVAVRAVVGQQVSVTGARTVIGKLTRSAGARLDSGQLVPTITHTFVSAENFAELPDGVRELLPMPATRRLALTTLAGLMAAGEVTIDPGTDPVDLTEKLTRIPGIGGWTASYIVMRGLGHPDVFMPTDLGIRRAAISLGESDDAETLTERSAAWRPWRSYATCHLWNARPKRETSSRESVRPTTTTADTAKGDTAA